MEKNSEIKPKELAYALKEWLDDGQLGRADEKEILPHKTLYALATLTSNATSDKWQSFSRSDVASHMRDGADKNKLNKDLIRKVTAYQKLPDYLEGANRKLMENFPKFRELGYIPKVLITKSQYRLFPVKLDLKEVNFEGDEKESHDEDKSEIEHAEDSTENCESHCIKTKVETIEYKPERPKLNSFGKMIFAHGYFPTKSWRGYFIKSNAIFCACLVFFLLLLTLWYFVELSKNPSSLSVFQPLLFLAFSLIIWHFGVAPLITLIDDRIKKMDDIWMPFHSESCELELAISENTRYFKVIRYKSCCSICGSEVMLHNGGREFFSRLVGRCSKSPREHVFSFDKVTLLGYPLRQNNNGYRIS